MIYPNFPLYDMLKKNSSDNSLSEGEKDEICHKISKIKTENKQFNDHEMIYAIIKGYTLEYNLSEIDTKNSKLGIKFDLNSFPNKLQQMIFLFLNLDKK